MMLPLLSLLMIATMASAADVQVTEVTPSVLVFATSNGNVVASVGTDGAFLVGTPSAASTSQISEILANRTKNPIRYVVIAPEDLAHSEGDAGWGKRGAFVAMQERALERLGGHAMGPMHPLPPRLVDLGVDRPRVAFSEVITFDINGDAIHVVHQTPGYSDADALVHFHMAHLLYFGELFPGDGYPEIDPQQHGSLEGFIKVLSPWENSNMRVVPARGPVRAAADLKDFCNMLSAVRDRVQKMVADGRTEDQIVAKHPAAEFDAHWGHGRVSPDAFVREVYAAVKAPQPKTTQP
jgi:cyclase